MNNNHNHHHQLGLDLPVRSVTLESRLILSA
jgi:hypothetical protein